MIVPKTYLTTYSETDMLTTVISLSTLLLVISLLVIRNLLLKVEELEDYVKFTTDRLAALSSDVKTAQRVIEQADVRGSFSSDDEIGEAFETIKSAITELEPSDD